LERKEAIIQKNSRRKGERGLGEVIVIKKSNSLEKSNVLD